MNDYQKTVLPYHRAVANHVTHGQIGRCLYSLDFTSPTYSRDTILTIAGLTDKCIRTYDKVTDAVRAVEDMIAAHMPSYSRTQSDLTVQRLAPELVSITIKDYPVEDMEEAETAFRDLLTYSNTMSPFFPIPACAHVQRMYREGYYTILYIQDDTQI